MGLGVRKGGEFREDSRLLVPPLKDELLLSLSARRMALPVRALIVK